MTTFELKNSKLDPYLLALGTTVALALFVPARGVWASVLDSAVNVAVAGLFFIYGVKLSRRQVLAALRHLPPQLLVLASTYVVFPLAGLALHWLFGSSFDPQVSAGILFLSIVPSTVQSSIAFTSIARGNVAAAICAASVSNLLGVVLTPALASLLLVSGAGPALSEGAIGEIATQILLPFVLGQAAKPLLAGWVERNALTTMLFDRGSILLIVYASFGAGTLAGVWQRLSALNLLGVFLLDVGLLAAILAFTFSSSRALGLERGDEIAVVFCGSKKSMASGVPMASALFPAHSVSLLLVPLLIFHQLQLFVCAVLARRYARGQAEGAALPGSASQASDLRE